MTFSEWVTLGIEKEWISPVFCHTHDGDPYMDYEEAQEWENGGDPCLHVFKILV
jgi:hypothetical protein